MKNPVESTTHDRLRREAAALFARRGYGGTSMSDIAARVGVRKASLYNYYASKDDLMFDLLERSLQMWEVACCRDLEGQISVEQRLAGHLSAAVEFGRSNPQAMGIIRMTSGQIPGDLRRRVHVLMEEHALVWRQTLQRVFAEAIHQGEVLDNDPAKIALFWSAFVDGILVNQVFATSKADAMLENLESLWRFFWRGVSGREPETEVFR